MTDKRIVFLGTPQLSAYVLEGMIKEGFNIVGVITKEDKPVGRKMILTPSPVAQIAKKYGIETFKPHKLNKEFDFLYRLNPDLLLTFAYGQLISTTILSLSKYKPLNLHASLLPSYRGAAPIQYALRNGEKETGISLMEMVKEMDAGDVYAVEKIEISPEDNYSSLCNKLQDLGLMMAVKYLPLYFDNKLVPFSQDASKVTFCPSIKKEEEHLNINLAPKDFVNQVRSLSLLPGGYLLEDESIIKIYEAEYYSDKVEAEEGTIVLAKKKDIVLQVNGGQVRLVLLQRPGKKMMSAQDYNNGNAFEVGKRLK